MLDLYSRHRPYADAILAGIENSDHLLLVHTAHSNESPHVLREVERAVHLRRGIIPIRFDTSATSRSLDYLLATVQWLSGTAKSGEPEIDRVVSAISRSVGKSQPDKLISRNPAATVAPKGGSRNSRPWLRWTAAAAILLLCIVIVAIVYSGSRQISYPSSNKQPNSHTRTVTPAAAPASVTIDDTDVRSRDEPGIYRGPKRAITPAYALPTPE